MPESTTLELQTDTTAEEPVEARWATTECTCPDWCEHDHEQD